MSWENEKQDYVKKLDNIIEGIEKINSISHNRIITKEVEKRLNDLLCKARNLMPKIRDGKFEVAVVGLEKAGKSSFSNALMEMDILPTDDQRCTYTSTCIEASDSDYATITFYSDSEFKRDFKEKLNKLEIPDAELYSYDSLTVERYEELFKNCKEYIKKEFKETLNQDIIDILDNKNELKRYIGSPVETMNGDVLTNRSFKSFITEPGKAIAVKEVRIFSSLLQAMPDATIFDVPGFNSPTAMHREQTIDKMRAVDVIVMVAKADEPSITGDVLSIFNESDEDGSGLSDKLFVFANKADRATNLEKNMEITYNEWIRKRKLLPEKYKASRFFFGSANAHLGDKVENGSIAKQALEKKGFTDGIEEFRNALEKYYKTERFEVLKKRVDRIIYDIKVIFKNLSKEYQLEPGLILTQNEALSIGLELSSSLGSKLVNKLNIHKENMNGKSRTELPLQRKIETIIDEQITLEKYHISDEEISTIHKSIAGISNSEDPRSVDKDIREQRFETMYNDFYNYIIDNTDKEHELNCQEIINIFMESMSINKTSSSYSILREKVIEFCNLEFSDESDKNEGASYYQSLIERFARDIYELLIKTSHDTGRLNKFRDENTNFFSLGVYYNAALSANTENILSYVNSTPEQSPLWRILLYPEILSCNESDLWDTLKRMSGIDRENATKSLGSLFNKLIINEKGNAVQVLESVIKKMGTLQGHPEIEIIMDIASAIKEYEGWENNNTNNNLEEILKSELSYENEINGRRSKYTYETIQEEFDNDIVALQKVLKFAVLNAISIDKAFSARETRIIERIIYSIKENTEKYRNFISDNIYLIKSKEFDRIREENAQKEADMAVMNQINTVLAEIR